LTQVAANDNISAAAFSRVTFTAQANIDYYIAIDGRAGSVSAGLFKMIYHPADFLPGFTISGSVTPSGDGVSIKAESLDGRIIASAITGVNGAYSIVIPQGVNSFKLTAFTDAIDFGPGIILEKTVYGFANFLNITQNRNYDFREFQRSFGIVLGGQFVGLNSGADLSVTVSGPNIVGSQQCEISTFGDASYTCAGLLPNGTYTVTPRHPSISFFPVSKTIVISRQNVLGAAFLAVRNNVPGLTIGGRIAQGNTPLNAVRVSIGAGFDLLETETDANGNYSFSHLPAGLDYNISASLPGFNFTASPLSEFPNLQSNQTVNFSAASNCSYTLSAMQQTVSFTGGFASFNITTNDGCPWEAKTESTGFTVTTPASFGSGTISYFVARNIGAPRTGTITVAGQTFTVSQSGGKLRKRIRLVTP
jgi:hypothetical protein